MRLPKLQSVRSAVLQRSLEPNQPHHRPQISLDDPLPNEGRPALRPKQEVAYAAVSVGLAPCILTTPALAKGHERRNRATARSRMNRLQSETTTCQISDVPSANQTARLRSGSRFRPTTPVRFHITSSHWWHMLSHTDITGGARKRTGDRWRTSCLPIEFTPPHRRNIPARTAYTTASAKDARNPLGPSSTRAGCMISQFTYEAESNVAGIANECSANAFRAKTGDPLQSQELS